MKRTTQSYFLRGKRELGAHNYDVVVIINKCPYFWGTCLFGQTPNSSGCETSTEVFCQ